MLHQNGQKKFIMNLLKAMLYKMKRLTLSNIVLLLCALMCSISLATIFVCKTSGEMFFTTLTFIGWSVIATILLIIKK
jgi:hypothetical protein